MGINMFSSNTALIIIDVQQGLDDPCYGKRSNPGAEVNMRRILNAWRKAKWPVVHIQHLASNPKSKLRPELPGCQIKDEVRPMYGERIFQKEAHSAFVGTGLEPYLRKNRYSELVLMGLTIEHCVSSTARSSDDLGFKTHVISDATAAFESYDHADTYIQAEVMHSVSLASLKQEFVHVLNTRQLLAHLDGLSLMT